MSEQGDEFFHSPSSVVRLDVGGTIYTTTISTLTAESDSMLSAMFSGRYSEQANSTKGTVFIDRDGTHFRHILNWLRNRSVPLPDVTLYHELQIEAEYYQLRGLLSELTHALKYEDENQSELSRKDVIKCLQSKKIRFRGVNFSGLDLSKLDLSLVDFSHCRLVGTFFSKANLQSALFREVNAEHSNFLNAHLKLCDFEKAILRKAILANSSLQSVNMQDVCLEGASLCGADLRSAHLQNANLINANLEGANLEGANLKGAKLSRANLSGANLQRAYLRDVDLRETNLNGANLNGANLQGTIR